MIEKLNNKLWELSKRYIPKIETLDSYVAAIVIAVIASMIFVFGLFVIVPIVGMLLWIGYNMLISFPIWISATLISILAFWCWWAPRYDWDNLGEKQQPPPPEPEENYRDKYF
jgi:uncharacterized membrane protein YraQ (UPF0718 family)